ncbi:MAG: methylmalonyl Co-A mutase-associated GTPase MeaB [Bryobacteraceae bacterium]|nr:methylmalonyl Co-A mutase-associated GTPase MeaB [Bryobacteraceae bacterium]
MQDWTDRILRRDIRAIARAATAIENHSAQSTELLKELFPHTGKAMILGVTGAPGAGKSTLVDQLTTALRGEGLRVGIIAVDPSSPFSGGAILGDRIRMQQHHADPEVFIRSMATRGHLGGLARGTLELSLLLDAAGYDAVLIETVGVGQDEVEIARLADVCAVVLVPGMGDDVQALKAGIMEIADVFVINKCDLPGVEKLEQELRAMMALAPHGAPQIPIVKTSSAERRGIDDLAAALRGVKEKKSRDGARLWSTRLREMLRDRLMAMIEPGEVAEAAAKVALRSSDPYSIVEGWMERFQLKR